MTLKNRISADFRRKNPEPDLVRCSDLREVDENRLVKPKATRPPPGGQKAVTPLKSKRAKNPSSIRRIRGNLPYLHYQRRISRADDVKIRLTAH